MVMLYPLHPLASSTHQEKRSQRVSPAWGIRWWYGAQQLKNRKRRYFHFGTSSCSVNVDEKEGKKIECGLQFVHFIYLISIFKFDIFKFCHSSLKERLWNGVDWMLPLSHRLGEIMQTKWLDLCEWSIGARPGPWKWIKPVDWLPELYFLFHILLPESI